MTERLRPFPVLRHLCFYPVFWAGYCVFRLSTRTPAAAYRSMRRLYTASQGRFNARVSKWIQRRPRAQPIHPRPGLVGDAHTLDACITNALADLERDGFHRFERPLPAEDVARLVSFARRTDCRLIPPPTDGPRRARFDPAHALAPRYQLDEEDVIAEAGAHSLLVDDTLIHIAERYLAAPPINDLVAMWWSAPGAAESRSQAAQLFHFDLDRLRFLKFFVYLTDVGPTNGPHVLVRGSHRRRPAAFYADRRFSDEEVLAAFPNDIVELDGPAGTILAVDTSALHKGKPLTTGHRLILQIEYTNTLFGQRYTEPCVTAGSQLGEAVLRHPEVFRRFSTCGSTV